VRLLYIGNMLSKHGKTPTSVETLGIQLGEVGHVSRYSDKVNPISRMLDMIFACIIQRNKADYAIIDTYSNWAFYYALICSMLLRWAGVRYIPVLHGGNLPVRLKQSPILCTWIFGNAHINVAPSGYLYEHFIKSGFRVRLIPNYITLADYPYKYRGIVRPRILWVRSFQSLYRPELAIETLENLLQSYPDASLCMVGPDKDGSLDVCERIISEKKLGACIRLTGKLSKDEWIALSETYDIFLNTTAVDNTPVSVMEAMALGMVVVTSKVGGIPWLFEDGKEGIMVADADSTKFADICSSLLKNPETAGLLSFNARKKAKTWDWSVVKSKWQTLLEDGSDI
jgi:glycosyltransferase involved in cell wall biosynthesis